MPRNWNRKLYQIHQWSGLITGLFLLLLSATGVFLVFADEIEHALHRDVLKVEPQKERVSLDAIYKTVQAAFPNEHVRGFRNLPREKDQAVTLAVDHGGRYWFVHVNPYTGKILGDRDADNGIVRSMLLLHYALWVRPWGEMVVCVLGFTLLLSVLTGTWIYRRSLGAVFRRGLRLHKGWRSFASDLHRLVGVTTLAFHLVIAVTGIWMLLPVFGQSIAAAPAKAKLKAPSLDVSLDQALQSATQALPGFVPFSLWVPSQRGDLILVYGRVPGTLLHSDYSSSVSIDPETAKVTEAFNANEAGLSGHWEAMLGPLHFGNWGGLPIKLLYSVLGLSPAVLSLTGFALYAMRKRAQPSARLHRAAVPRESVAKQLIGS